MKSLVAVLLTTLPICIALAAPAHAHHRCFGPCQPFAWRYNQWGAVGLVQGAWGLGGVADAPWVGGSVFGVTSYAPYPYGMYLQVR